CYVCLLNSDVQAVIGPTRLNEISQGFAFLRERVIRFRDTRRLQRSEIMSGRMRRMVLGVRIEHGQSCRMNRICPGAYTPDEVWPFSIDCVVDQINNDYC